MRARTGEAASPLRCGRAAPGRQLDRWDAGRLEFVAVLPGPDQPARRSCGWKIWEPIGDGFERAEYLYDLIEHPLDRRRGLHAHDTDVFARRFGVLVHEHCEESLGRPACDHYHGIPVGNGYEALDRLLRTWGQPGPLGCSALRCIG